MTKPSLSKFNLICMHHSLKALHSNHSLRTIVNDTFIFTSNNRFHGEKDKGAIQWKSPHQPPCPPDQLQTPTKYVDTSSHTCTRNVRHVKSFRGKNGKKLRNIHNHYIMSHFFLIRPPSRKRSETNLMILNRNLILIAFDRKGKCKFSNRHKQIVLLK